MVQKRNFHSLVARPIQLCLKFSRKLHPYKQEVQCCITSAFNFTLNSADVHLCKSNATQCCNDATYKLTESFTNPDLQLGNKTAFEGHGTDSASTVMHRKTATATAVSTSGLSADDAGLSLAALPRVVLTRLLPRLHPRRLCTRSVYASRRTLDDCSVATARLLCCATARGGVVGDHLRPQRSRPPQTPPQLHVNRTLLGGKGSLGLLRGNCFGNGRLSCQQFKH